MLSQILKVALCLNLLLPVAVCAMDEEPGEPASGRAVRPTQPAEQQTPDATSQPADPDSPQALDREEDASLSQRAEDPDPEVAGGALSTLHLTYAVIALAAAVLVLLLK